MKTFIFGQAVDHQTSLSAIPKEYVCDTWAERPTSGLVVGSRMYCLENEKLYRATNATTWAEIGGAAGGAAWGEITGTLSAQTDLQAALDAKSGTGHNHAGVYEPAGTVSTHAAAADPHTGYQKESERGAPNGYASLGADGLVPASQLPASGSDPWTYLRLASDFLTSSATAVDITGLGFAAIANTRYEFVARLMVRTATATVGPRPGVAWPTGMTDGVAFIQQTSSATANVFANGNINAAVLAPVGGLPNNTQSYPALIEGTAIAGASPSGNIRLQLASETGGTTVRAVAGSFLKYRTIP